MRRSWEEGMRLSSDRVTDGQMTGGCARSLMCGNIKEAVGSRCDQQWGLNCRDNRVGENNGTQSCHQGFIMF